MDENIPSFDQTEPVPAAEGHAAESVPSFDETKPVEDFESPTQKIATAIEGAARGLSGGLTDVAAKYLRPGAEKLADKIGINADLLVPKIEDVAARQEINPYTSHGSEIAGVAAGLLKGVGVPGVVGKIGQAVVPAAIGTTAARTIGAAALRGALETSLLQGGNEISQWALGKGDPEAPVSSALVHMGAAGLMGGAIGGVFGGAGVGLKKLADTKMGARASQFLEDFGNRWKFNQENPDLAKAVTDELHTFHQTTAQAADEVYGAGGLKSQAIRKLVPQMNEAITQQNEQIAQRLQSRLTEMAADTETYPTRLTKKLTSDVNEWLEVATNPEAKAHEVFEATQGLKQRLQAYSKFDRSVGPLSPERDFISATKELQHDLVTKLEDSRVWGEAGNLQKGINKAFSKFLEPLKDFSKRFTSEVGGEKVVDPGKVLTFVNQSGGPRASIKGSALGNYIDAATKYRGEIENLYHAIGIDSPIAPASINAIKGALGAGESAGAKAADSVYHVSLPKFAAQAAHSGAGAAIGYHEGGIKGAVLGGAVGAVAPHIESALIRKLTHKTIPWALNVMSSGNVKNIGQVIDYASHVDSGAQKLTRGLDYLFKSGVSQPIYVLTDHGDRERLKKYVESGKLNDEIKEQLNSTPAQEPVQHPKGFAEGGLVQSQFGQIPKVSNAQPVTEGTDALAEHYPTQNMMLQTARGRINNYLNSLRPQADAPKLPFDRAPQNKQKEKTYDKVIDLANRPLSILSHIKNGSLTPDQVKHFVGLYPELYSHLNKKMTERVSEMQMTGERPPFKVRQALSLFLNAPLDSSMTPQTILAAQSVFANKRAAQQQSSQESAPKKSTAPLSKVAGGYKTAGQALETRHQRDR